VAHGKYIVDQQRTAVHAQLSTGLMQADAAKGDAEAYDAATTSAFTGLLGSVVANPNLTPELRDEWLEEAGLYALEGKNIDFYHRMRDTPIRQPDGTYRSIVASLPWESQVKLSKAYDAAKSKTAIQRGALYDQQTAVLKSRINGDDPAKFPTFNELQSHIDTGVGAELLTREARQSLYQDWLTKGAKRQDDTNVAKAYRAGDIATYSRLGKSEEQALDSYVAGAYASGANTPQVVQSLLNIGVDTGQDSAFKHVGKIMAPAFNKLGRTDSDDPSNVAMVQDVFTQLDQAERDGTTGRFEALLQGMPGEIRDKVVYMRAQVKQAIDPITAAKRADALLLADSAYTPAERNAIQAQQANENVKAVQSLDERGMLGSAWLAAKSLVSTSAGAEADLTVRRKWFENPDRVQEALIHSRRAVLDEMNLIGRTNPGMSVDSRYSKAVAAVQGRTLVTDQGPLVLPPGLDIPRFFGVAPNTDNGRIANAMNDVIKPAEGNRAVVSISPDKDAPQLMVIEYGAKGEVAKSYVLNPQDVGVAAKRQDDLAAARYGRDLGGGVTRERDGVKVTFNGANTAEVEPRLMRKFRDRLVDHEGIRDRAYPDGAGKAVGVGVNSINRENFPTPDADGNVTQKQIDDSFAGASNQAANRATIIMRNAGIGGDDVFMLLAEMAYQSGSGGAGRGAAAHMINAIKTKDAAEAMKQLRETPAYKASGADRRAMYETQLIKALK
jgi:hypothetical protein